jgi:hypothetical protein
MNIEIKNDFSEWCNFTLMPDVYCGVWCEAEVIKSINSDESQLKIIYVYDDNNLVAVLPFKYTSGTIPFMLGLWRLGGIHARMLKLPDYEFGIVSSYDRRVVFAEVAAELKRKKICDLVMADNWPAPGRGARNVQETYLIDMPEDFDAWMMMLSSNTRQVLRRRARKMQKEFGEELYVKEFCSRVEMKDLHGYLFKVWEKSWHGRLNRQSPPDINILELLADNGWVRSFVLFVDNTPIATVQGYQYNGIFMDEAPAYDDKWKKYSPGLVLNYFIIERLFKNNTPQVVDFGFGYNQYKEMLGTRAEVRGQLWQGISLKGKYILTVIRLCDTIFKIGKRFFGKSKIATKLKVKAQRG